MSLIFQLLERSYAVKARDMMVKKEPEQEQMSTTSREYGSWTGFKPTSEPMTAEKLAQIKLRGFRSNGQEPQTVEEAEAEIARLQEELSHPTKFSDPISVYSEADGTQTRSLAGTSYGGLHGKKGFNKQTDFSMPIDQYTKTKWKDI